VKWQDDPVKNKPPEGGAFWYSRDLKGS